MILHRSLAALVLLAGAANAETQLQLTLPAECILGDTCFIQQYPDVDPSERAQDYMCQGLSYDGHKGTDFALPSLRAMRAGVNVLAPADGIVLRVRNDMIDQIYSAETATSVNGRDCGNGVVLDHGDGWETQLCHMRQGSLTVQPGETVKRGAALGLIGLSGRTQFPHVHLSLRKDGAVVDPFRPGGDCGGPGPDHLWAFSPIYQPGGLLNAGLATAVPSYSAVKEGSAAILNLPADAPALVAWGYGFGARAGDVLRQTITGPDGATIFQRSDVIDRAQAQFFRAAGRKLRGARWTPGSYTVEIDLLRDGSIISTQTDTIISP
ncbi:M23 family metallopeptidase [Roseovarius dicentrarchi]|uniref:M23 family metallopeptidase n=1 Tax=Roseovarius dicentrarchi TaxID=2250573 RepID=UPI000DE990C1|nr:M23 family metallopeptidase [Roseovarius dicentrarchi]